MGGGCGTGGFLAQSFEHMAGVANANLDFGRARLPSPLPPPLLQNAKLLMVERNPGEAVIPGAPHNVQRTGAPFNERLEAFLGSAKVASRAA